MLSVRPVRDADEALLLEWANDPLTQAGAFHGLITPAEHRRWFRSRMAPGSGCFMWLLVVDGEPVALARYERSGTLLEINLTVAPEQRGHGYGEAALELTAALAFAASGATRCRALVSCDNAASLTTFERAGYERIGREAIVLEKRAE